MSRLKACNFHSLAYPLFTLPAYLGKFRQGIQEREEEEGEDFVPQLNNPFLNYIRMNGIRRETGLDGIHIQQRRLCLHPNGLELQKCPKGRVDVPNSGWCKWKCVKKREIDACLVEIHTRNKCP